MGRIAGIDFGRARIGLALSDDRKILASALDVIVVKGPIETTTLTVRERFSAYPLEAIIIGLPLHLKGTIGHSAEEVRLFASALEQKMDCPIIFWDERLSTLQAERVLKEGNVSRKKRKLIIDSLSAVIILQSYLDSISII